MNGTDFTAGGIAMLGTSFVLLLIVLGIIYSIIAFLVPIMIWKMLRRLTEIRDSLKQPTTSGATQESWYNGSLKSEPERNAT